MAPDHPAPHTLVPLYESNAGDLFIAVNGEEYAWDVTAAAARDGFSADAIALLDEETADWTMAHVPLSTLDHPDTRAIATFNSYLNAVEIHRGSDGHLLARHAGWRYLDVRPDEE